MAGRVLARLKDDAVTRHIPVHIITTEEQRERGLRMGAVGRPWTKPLKIKGGAAKHPVLASARCLKTSHQRRSWWRAATRSRRRGSLSTLVGGEGINIVAVDTGHASAWTGMTQERIRARWSSISISRTCPDWNYWSTSKRILDSATLPSSALYCARPVGRKRRSQSGSGLACKP